MPFPFPFYLSFPSLDRKGTYSTPSFLSGFSGFSSDSSRSSMSWRYIKGQFINSGLGDNKRENLTRVVCPKLGQLKNHAINVDAIGMLQKTNKKKHHSKAKTISELLKIVAKFPNVGQGVRTSGTLLNIFLPFLDPQHLVLFSSFCLF